MMDVRMRRIVGDLEAAWGVVAMVEDWGWELSSETVVRDIQGGMSSLGDEPPTVDDGTQDEASALLRRRWTVRT